MLLLKRFFSKKNFNSYSFLKYHSSSGNVKPSWLPFFKAKYGNFVQEPPVLKNQFIENVFLKNYLCHNIPKELYPEIKKDLTEFGHRVSTEINYLGYECELNKPYLKKNSWGKDDKDLVVCDAWKKQKEISAQEGLVSIGYDRSKYGQSARLYQFSKLYLYAPSSGLFSCPLAMTDGAAKTLEFLNLHETSEFDRVFSRLTSRDPSLFWTSGQWMTEKAGGSDVGNATETIALPMNKSTHSLYGYKWFSSATDADIALTLARVADDEGNVVQGSNGLTLFYVPVKDANGSLSDHISIIQLKDKLGTRQLPTAELLLDGAKGIKISEEGRGINSMSRMLQITRLHNAISCSSYIQRAYTLARDYAEKRRAFSKKLIDLPLHIQTLSRIDLASKTTFLFALENVRLLGMVENGVANDEEKLLLRILNPLAKLYNSKIAINAISESIEAIGGQGIIEDTGLPCLYRDAQIFAIWEGTTSVLSLDVLRSLMTTNGDTFKAFRSNVVKRLDTVSDHTRLKELASKVSVALEQLFEIVKKEPGLLEFGGRDFAFSLSNIFISTLLLETAARYDESFELHVQRFILTQDLVPYLTNCKLNEYSVARNSSNKRLVLEN